MKVLVITPKEDREIIFPCLMIAGDNMIILATGYNVDSSKSRLIGTLLDPGDNAKLSVGNYSVNWSAVCFKPVPSGVEITLMP